MGRDLKGRKCGKGISQRKDKERKNMVSERE